MKIKRKKKKQNPLLAQIATHKGSFTLYLVLRGLVILVLVLNILGRDWQNMFICIATLILFYAPPFVETRFHLRLPATLQNIVLLFIFGAEILGEIGAFYIWFPWWDTMLHTLCGFLVAGVGFSLVNILNESEKVIFRLSPIFLTIVAFCFSMTVGVCWEFIEYTADRMWGLDMQKDTVIHEISSVKLDKEAGGNRPVRIGGITEVAVNGEDLGLDGYLDVGLYDTMEDLWVNCAGAVVFCAIGYQSLKSEEKRKFIGNFVVQKERGKMSGEESKEE